MNDTPPSFGSHYISVTMPSSFNVIREVFATRYTSREEEGNATLGKEERRERGWMSRREADRLEPAKNQASEASDDRSDTQRM